MKLRNNIIMKKVEKIIPYARNNKKHPESQINLLVSNIKEFGFNVPILLDINDNLVAGHGRLLAAIKLNMKEIPAIVCDDLNEAQIKALRIADNRLTELAETDWEMLKLEYEELVSLDYDVSLTGYELSDMPENEGESRDSTPDDPNEIKTDILLGDMFKLGEHRLMCGDSTDAACVGLLMLDEKAILMVTDPPYGVNYNPAWRDDADKAGVLGNKYPTRSMGKVKNDDRADWFEAWELFSGDVAYVYHAGLYSSVVAESLEKAGFELKSQIIWSKPHFALSRGDYHWKHEPIWYAVKKGKKHNWQGSRKEHTVWEISGMNAMGASHDENDKATGHGTQKPIECMIKPILNSSCKNELVYDPFGGSGSTLIACENTKRKCRMMELDPIYCQVIINRWEKLTGKKAVKL